MHNGNILADSIRVKWLQEFKKIYSGENLYVNTITKDKLNSMQKDIIISTIDYIKKNIPILCEHKLRSEIKNDDFTIYVYNQHYTSRNSRIDFTFSKGDLIATVHGIGTRKMKNEKEIINNVFEYYCQNKQFLEQKMIKFIRFSNFCSYLYGDIKKYKETALISYAENHTAFIFFCERKRKYIIEELKKLEKCIDIDYTSTIKWYRDKGVYIFRGDTNNIITKNYGYGKLLDYILSKEDSYKRIIRKIKLNNYQHKCLDESYS